MQLILLINPPREDHFMLYGSTSNDEVLACVRKEPSLAAHWSPVWSLVFPRNPVTAFDGRSTRLVSTYKLVYNPNSLSIYRLKYIYICIYIYIP